MGRYDHHKTRRLLKRLHEEMGIRMSENTDRIDAALTGLTGDIAGLKAAAAAVQAALDAALADQTEEVAAAVAAAVASAQSEFESSLDALAARAEALDSETPAVPEQDPLPEG